MTQLKGWARAAIVVSPLAFLVHDLEEWWTLDRWEIPDMLRSAVEPPTPAVFGVAIGVLFTVHAAVAVAALLRPRARSVFVLLGLVASARLANAFAHLLRSAVDGSYLPGLWSAGVVALPVALTLILIAGRRLELSGVGWWGLLVGGAVLQVPMILLSLRLGRWLVAIATQPLVGH